MQGFRSDHLTSLAQKQQNHLIEVEPVRGTIYDRNMRPMAFNVTVYSLYANPRAMSEEDKQEAITLLSEALHLSPSFLKDRLSKDKFFVWLERKIPPEKYERLQDIKIKGLGFKKESKRYYPNRELASHIIGFAGVDNNGLEGLELSYNRYLKGQAGKSYILQDARQRQLAIHKDFFAPVDGANLVLTIDETIQYLAETALEKAYIKYKAKSATIIVIDTNTGELLALANQPTYDLDEVSKSSVANRTNRALSFVYEPGSVFKIVTATAAFEEEVFTETDSIFCENGEYVVGGKVLHDHHPHGKLSFVEVFEQSSNIGVAKIAQKLGPDIIYKYAKRFHFGSATGIDLKGEVEGILKHPKRWSKTSIGAIPMGHEVLVTPLQLVYAIAAIANDGILMKPFVVKEVVDTHNNVLKTFEPQVVDRVMSSDTAKRVTEILKGVVERGTGKKAAIKGMTVAGKTGTAQKVENGVYSHSKFYATFFGFAPADNPQIAAIVILDEPRPSYFGGTVSAPVFKEVVENALKYRKSAQPEVKLSVRLK